MKNLNELRALPAEELMKLAEVRAVPVYNIDGYFMKEQPVEVFAKGEQTKAFLLIGGNNQEMTPAAVLMGKQPTVENLKAAPRLHLEKRTSKNSSASTASTAIRMYWSSRA